MQQVDKSNGGSPAPINPDTAVAPSNGRPPEAPSAPGKRKPPVALIAVVAVALIGGGVYGAKWWIHRQAFVSTDDAQVSGNVVNVSSRVPGHIAQLLVDEGQNVKANQVVAKLDDTDFKAQLAQAQAALAVAETGLRTSQTGVFLQSTQSSTQLAQAQSAVRAAQAGLATAEANDERAHADLKRLQRLYAAGGISEQALEAARTGATAADSGVTAASSQLKSSQEAMRLAQAGTQQVAIKQGGVQTVQAQIAAAQAAVNSAQLQLDHTTITSPVDGVVARRMANVGEQVQPGQGLFAITQTNDVWVSAYVEETNIRRVHQNAPVDVHVDAYPKETFHGRVQDVGSVTGAQFSLLPQNNAAGNYTKVVQRIPVKVTVDDPKHQLKPGMSAVIDIDARP